MIPPGAKGLAGGAGRGLGVTAALVATEGGRVGARTAAAPAAPIAATPAFGVDGDALGGGRPGADGAGCGAAATAGVTVWAWPCGLVMVTRFVVLLTTTVLWMLL
jgi:hypothetical protein